jgi:Leucine-rich repeat (LRR) protein
MTGLTRLTLSGCSLKVLDEGFVGAFLIMLTMSNNGFNSLPANIMNMHALQTLTFNSNALSRFVTNDFWANEHDGSCG